MRKFILVLISLLVNPFKTINGCGWGLMPEDYRVYLLNQSVLNHNELMPLFYSSEFFFNTYNWYTSQYAEDPNDPTEQTNAQEWKEHTHYKGPVSDIVQVIYREDINSVLQPNDSILGKNPFLKYLLKHYKKEYDYLAFAKKCELANEDKDPWGLRENNADYIQSLSAEGGRKLKEHPNTFLELRYAYQLVKLDFYYPGQEENCDSIYNQHIAKSPLKSWLKPSAEFYIFTQGHQWTEEKQYRLVLSFDRAIDKRFRCVQLFDRKNYKKILRYAKNKHEEANMYVMYELQNPGRSLTHLEKIAELDPSNEFLPFLITREINKLEDWLLTPELTSFEPSVMEYQYSNDSLRKIIDVKSLSNKKYLLALYAFAQKLAMKNNTKASEYNLLSSNICILLKQKEKAFQHLELAEKATHSPQIQFQILFNRIAMEFDGSTKLTKKLEEQFLGLAAFHTKNKSLLINQETSLSQLYLYAGCRLIKAGDVAKGILFCSKTNRPLGEIAYWQAKSYLQILLENAQAKDYDEILALLGRPKKTEFEKFLLARQDLERPTYFNYYHPDSASVDKNKILDYKSMYFVQRDMLDSALACVTKIDAAYWQTYPYKLFRCFPFTSGNAGDYTSNNDFYPYNKRQYLQRLIDVKYLAENKIGDVAKHYFVLANGYFNMGYHGNYWIMNMPYKLSDEIDNGYYTFSSNNKNFLENYYGCKKAEYYFLKAFETTSDTGLAAICIHKADMCNENYQVLRWRLNNTYDKKNYGWKYELKISQGKYKYLFKNKFKGIDFYEDYVSNCYYGKHMDSYYY